ncbi:DNA-binding response regulator, OmpR family, contains REC and winged-helix (wHTH) domain [Evansella caseinilytica]|uniref:DNA-binding response regulator, OmpR family, contains REC and winged-helix (WHTH) domain n=1 Tax=Evansella caseinilytica TaxID=1503961 RepID=A0A1H3IMN7_9BACI|nr:response regulator transcription factor [Evansella caseinilytica]SDY28951.1 DNA-binding response regulator, OmpR family, contains REC and winged-helix (wHTH) domain [Evansella caseinilytica]
MQSTNILIVDDEAAIAKMIKIVLQKEGFTQIYTAETAAEALAVVKQQPIDFIVLDVMLPDRSGFDICPELRRMSNAYILFLTAKVSDLDKLTGFAIGGDDYITKPFNPLEIVARINARLRRQAAAPTDNLQITAAVKKTFYSCSRFSVNEQAGELVVDGKVVPCPAQVFLLLLHFCKHPDQVFSKTQLLEAVWGMDSYVDDNTVMVHIRRIRERIEEDPGKPKYLVTVRGLGYKLVKEKQQ